MDIERLKADYIAQHRGQNFNSSDSSDDDEDPIDVVGVPDDSHEILAKLNPFSIDNLLFKRS